MTWQLITNETVAVYQLTDGNQTTTTLKLNTKTGSIRLSYGVNRLFFINLQKGPKVKYNINNEYGYPVGQFTAVDESTGTIRLDKELFFYITENGSTRLFNRRNEEILFCNAAGNNLHTTALLFASVWIFQNTATELMHRAQLQPYGSFARL